MGCTRVSILRCLEAYCDSYALVDICEVASRENVDEVPQAQLGADFASSVMK